MERINKLKQHLKTIPADGILITSVPNITYLTGFMGDSSRLIVSSEGCFLIADDRYTEQAQNECHKGVEIVKWVGNKRYGVETYNHICKLYGIKSLGFEGNVVPWSDFEILRQGMHEIELIPTNNIVEKDRMLKDDYEIECIRTACQISDKALRLTIPLIKEGISEIELAAQLEYNLKTNGANDLSFETILLFGARTSLLHGKPSQSKLKKGDFILFDFGALYKGYHADISRTLVFGHANQQQAELYNIIQEAQMKAIESLKHGISAQIPDKMVRSVIPAKYIDYYYSGMGHGLGLVIHEEPFISQTSQSVIESNTVLTVEPGIYIPKWGGLRIEDTVLVSGNSFEILSQFPRELITL
jgi:Xaa-Pro aminopeptidase